MPELLKSFAWDFFVLFFYAQVVGLNGEVAQNFRDVVEAGQTWEVRAKVDK